MPNHVTNELKIGCGNKRLEEVLTAIQYEPEPGNPYTGYGTVDFNKIVPMPEELNIEASSKTFLATEVYLTFLNPAADWFGDASGKLSEKEYGALLDQCNSDRIFSRHRGDLQESALTEQALGWKTEEMLALGRQAVSNIRRYGATTWYEWRTHPDHWNTKWNSYDGKYEGNGVLRFQTAWTAPHPVIRALSERYPDIVIEHAWADEDIGFNCGSCRYADGMPVEEYEPQSREEAIRFAERLWEESEMENAESVRPELGLRGD